MLKRITEYLLYLLVFLLPLQTRYFFRMGELNGGYFEYGSISLYGSDILIIILLILFLFQFRWKEIDNKIDKIWYVLAGLELFIFVSCFSATDKTVAFYNYGRFLIAISFFFLLRNISYSRQKLFFVFWGSIFVQSCLAIWQFLSQSVVANKWMGMAAQHADSYSSVIEVAGGGRWLRAYGSFSHPNMLGAFLVFGILFGVVYLVKFKGKNQIFCHSVRNEVTEGIPLSLLFRPVKINAIIKVKGFLRSRCGMTKLKGIVQNDDYSENDVGCDIHGFKSPTPPGHPLCKGGLENIFILVTISFSTIALFFSFSRAAWLSLSVGFFSFFIILIIQKKKKELKKLFLYSCILVFLFTIPAVIYSDLILTRVSGGTRLENRSIDERTELVQDAKGIIKDNFLFGVGMGNYTMYTAENISKNQPSYFYQPVHNVFLLVWSEIGIFGLSFFVLLFSYFLLCLKGRLSLRGTIATWQSILITLPLLTMFLFDHWWWSLHFGLLFLFFLLSFRNGANA